MFSTDHIEMLLRLLAPLGSLLRMVADIMGSAPRLAR